MSNLEVHDILQTKIFLFQTAPILADAFGLGKILSVKNPDVFSHTSKKCILFTDTGSYFVKELPSYRSREEWLFTSMVQHAISENVPEVVQPLPTTDGSRILSVGNKHYHVTPLVAGKYFHGTLQEIHSAGQLCARVHAKTIQLKTPVRFQFNVIQTIDHLLSLIPSPTQSEQDWIIEIRRQIQGYSEEIISYTCTPCVIHGDISPFNFLFQNFRRKFMRNLILIKLLF